ncbi:hypothetical protein DPMN_113769 [Dreissena polymorpha]|uniref:Uncharacterized protein n=1 Tax=Dreissena polymorpha TaxID=45954 RepID=A0A9D4KI04_DREPO|nr:hypothetical protein DPMN_113769 [Dreissena polymorpha]
MRKDAHFERSENCETAFSKVKEILWLFGMKEPSGKIARWLEILAPYDFEIEYRPGSKQTNCDALSRCAIPKDCECADVDMTESLKCGPCRKCRRRAELMVPKTTNSSICMLGPSPELKEGDSQVDSRKWAINEDSSLSMISTGNKDDEHIKVISADDSLEPSSSNDPDSEIRKPHAWTESLSAAALQEAQENDADIGPILKALRSGTKPSNTEMTSSRKTRHYWVLWSSLKIGKGALHRRFRKHDGAGEFDQLIVPRNMRTSVIKQAHDTIASGHMGE